MRLESRLGAVLVLAFVFAGCGDDASEGGTSVRAVIGTEGGELSLAGGVKVEIPPDALTEATEIKITKLDLLDVAPLPFNLLPAGEPYAFEPHGLLFMRPVKITLPFDDDADVAQVRPVKLADQEDTSWQTVVGAAKDGNRKELRLDVDSFSVYLAARPNRASGVITLDDGAVVSLDAGPDATMSFDAGTDAAMLAPDASMDAAMLPFDAGMDAMSGFDAALMDATSPADAGADADVDAGPTPLITYLKASNTAADDQFGQRMAMDGDTLVIGAPDEDGNGTAQADNTVPRAGAVYVFVHDGVAWQQQAYLKAGSPGASDRFGCSVAISGDTIAVGACSEDGGAQGVNGNQNDDSQQNSGAAYVFVRNGSSWTQEAYLKASNSLVDLAFGTSLALRGNTLIVGAPNEPSASTTIDGNQADTGAPAAGAAYVFTRSGTTWAQATYVKASNAEAGDNFGASVALNGMGDVVIGAPGEDSATELDPNDNSASNAGAAYVFLEGNPWQLRRYVKASNAGANDGFGATLSMDRGTFAVGAPAEDSNATGTDGDGSNNLADLSGAVYVWSNDEGGWIEIAYLKPNNTASSQQFGRALSLRGDQLIVGAVGEASDATGIGGDSGNLNASGAGAAYVFFGVPYSGCCREFATFTQQGYLKATNTESSDGFGISVAVTDTALAVGASSEDSAAVGINGNAADNSAFNAGAAYVFPPITPTFVEVCDSRVDDDGDGFVDCADSDCATTFACVSSCNAPAAYTPLDATSTGLPSAGLVLWLRADVGVSLDGSGNVCAWEDQSGGQRNVVQATPSARPLSGGSLGTQPAIELSGLGRELSRPGVLDIAPTSGRSMFAALRAVNTTGRCAPIYQGQTGSNSAWVGIDFNTFNTVGQRFGAYMTGNAYDADLALDLAPHVHTLVVDTMAVGTPVLSAMRLYLDGSQRTLTRTAGGTGNGLIESFAGGDVTLIGSRANAVLAEVIVYDRALSTAERVLVETYLATRYGISLP